MCKDELRDETRRLSPEEWRETANFVMGLANLVEGQNLGETANHEERKDAIRNMHRMMENAAAACIYVADFAAEGVTFSVRNAEGATDE